MELPFGFWLEFIYNNGTEIHTKYLDLGKIMSPVNRYSPSNTSQGIPTQPAQNRFVMNTGVKRTLTLDFDRVNPHAIVDEFEPETGKESTSLSWSNGFWAYVVRRFLVNRWQGETDGCKLIFASRDEELYPSIGRTNCYITGFSIKQGISDTNHISGTIQLAVGATNIQKVSAKHTIIYQSDYAGNKSGYSGAESNVVKAYNEEISTLIPISTNWLVKAVTEGIISDVPSGQDNSVWAMKNPDGTETEYPQRASLDMSRMDSVITLYARYKDGTS